MSSTDAGAALPRAKLQILPALTPILVVAIAAPFVGSFSTFVTLTLASFAMGMMIFTMASGLTLTFGMMDVLNFGHGAFIAVGAYVATLVLLPLTAWAQADSFWLNLAAFFAVLIGAAVVSGVVGLVFERVLIVPVYGQHLKQILITIGGSIVIEQMLYALFGPAQIPITPPTAFHGSFSFGEIAVEKYRVLAFVVGFAIFLGQMLVLNRTKIGLLIRAGVENREMVEALGYRIDRLFAGVFIAGAAIAGLGGAMWSFYRGQVHASMGGELLVMVFIVIIIGGLGSVGGCFVASILVALIANYAGFLFPKFVILVDMVPQLAPLWYVLSKFALVSNILLMVVVLLWRPRGLYPVGGR